MKKLAMLAIGAAVAIAALGAESSAGKPSAEAAKFVSKRYGYSLVLTGQWKATYAYARTGWTGNFPLMGSGQVDVFTDSTGERFFIVAATRVPAGTTLRTWERSHAEVMSGSAFCRKARAFRSTKLGGGSAREFLVSCLIHDAIVVVAVHRGRGYTFQFVSPKEDSVASDRGIFEPGRRSFRFTS